LLEIIIRLLPSPAEGNPPRYLKGNDAAALPIPAGAGPAKHALAHVFEITMDPFAGKIDIFRVHQDALRRDTQPYIGDGRKAFRVGHLYLLQEKELIEPQHWGRVTLASWRKSRISTSMRCFMTRTMRSTSTSSPSWRVPAV